MVGRAAGLLADLHVDLQPAGWRLVDRPGRDAKRIGALLREDLDELAEAFDGYEGDLKLQVAGPWTLASSLWLTRGERAVVDEGACRDLVASLAEGLSVHLRDVARLVPAARLVVQVDEPGLPGVLQGSLPTASGFGRLRAVDPHVVADGLRTVLAVAGEGPTVIHCCAPSVPLPLLRSTGVGAISLDTGLLGPAGWESVAATVESGVALWAGIVPTDGETPGAGELTNALVGGWRGVGLPLADLADVTITPTCGLAGLTPKAARNVQRAAVHAARALTETAGS
jgi:cobalamin-independent methionine synthase catalytic subunit